MLADGLYERLKPENPKCSDSDTVVWRRAVCWAAGAGRDSTRSGIASATILTTQANGVCRPVHDRTPCVLSGEEAEAAWLLAEV